MAELPRRNAQILFRLMVGLFAISTLAACTLFSVRVKDTPQVWINSAFLRGDTFVIDYNVVTPGQQPPSYWAEYRHGREPVIHRVPFSKLDAAGAAPVPIEDVKWVAGETADAEHLKSRLERAAKAVRDSGPRIYRIAPPATTGADRYYLAYLGPGDAGVQVIELAPQGSRIHWGKVTAIVGIVIFSGCVLLAAAAG